VSDDRTLLAAAGALRSRAYAPYSQFTVGAALLDIDGRVWSGANVENASYGLSMCAERGALFHAVAEGVRAFAAIAVAGPSGVTALPCGACRQVLWEFAPGMRVISAGASGPVSIALADLLPAAFGPEQLRAAAASGEERR